MAPGATADFRSGAPVAHNFFRQEETPMLSKTRYFEAILCIALPAVAVAQNFTTFTEWTLPTANSGPADIAIAGKSTMYFSAGSKIGFLDTGKNTVTEWSIPNTTFVLGLNLQGQKVAFGAWVSGTVGLLDPNGNSVSQWAVPPIGTSSPLITGVTSQGKTIFFADWGQGAMGSLNPSTNQITLWPMPLGKLPQRMTVAGSTSALQVWVADQTGVISMLKPGANTFTEWQMPLPPGAPFAPSVYTVAIRADGTVLFEDVENSMIGVLNPATNLFSEWTMPTAFSAPLGVASLSATVAAFTEQFVNKVGTLDLTAPPDFQAAVAPAITTVTPIMSVVAPSVAAVAQTVTPLTPVVTGASRTVTGGFTEYPVPTPNALPFLLGVNTNEAIFFSELGGNKIGLLQ
jgi:streptogramin lyase